MYIKQALDLIDGLLEGADDNKEVSEVHLQMVVIFSLMWSLGALLEHDDRRKVFLF